jgi:sugar lactone lactonase YvrE
MWGGGVLMNADGAVLSSGGGGIMWNHPETGRSGWLIRELEGKPVNGVNEMWPDGTGGIFFGTVDIEMVEQAGTPRPTAIYRLTRDKQAIRLAEDVNFSNGIGYDPERRRFYCSDTFNVVWAWDVAPDLTLANRRVLVHKDDADGLALDGEGNVWITGFRSPGSIARVTPDGAELPPFPIPGLPVCQVRFGGADLRDVYLTAVPPGAGDVLKEGGELQGSAHIYRGRSDVAGRAVGTADFTLA